MSGFSWNYETPYSFSVGRSEPRESNVFAAAYGYVPAKKARRDDAYFNYWQRRREAISQSNRVFWRDAAAVKQARYDLYNYKPKAGQYTQLFK